jgi:hypothetical protein
MAKSLASTSIIKNNDRSTKEQSEEKKKRLKDVSADKHQSGQTAGAPLVRVM